jgi:hypothetical protein
MGKTYVKNGTPVGTASRCETCVHAHIVHGYRESETIVACMFSYDHPLMVPFKVRECTNHEHKNRPTWEQMEKLALPIMEATTSKKAGFLTSGHSEDNDN